MSSKPPSESEVNRLVARVGPYGRPRALCYDKGNLWTRAIKPRPGERIPIKISFLNGTNQLNSFVEEAARTWELYANIKFVFVSPLEDSHIRVRYGKRSWSYIGIAALNPKFKGKATMSLEITPGLDHENISTILHEFGHALGFQHEHSSPVRGAVFTFNKDGMPFRLSIS